MAWAILGDLISLPDEKSRVGYSEEHMRIPVEAVVLGAESPKLPDTDDKGKKLPVIEVRRGGRRLHTHPGQPTGWKGVGHRDRLTERRA